VRYPSPALDLDDLFLFEALRKVASDRTVSLNGVVFEVDAALVGERVRLRFDPATPLGPVEVVHAGRRIERARRVDLYANCFVKRHRPSGRLEIAEPAADPVAAGTEPQGSKPRPAVVTSSLRLAGLVRDDRRGDADRGDDDRRNDDDADRRDARGNDHSGGR
jgi:hypothetical protein